MSNEIEFENIEQSGFRDTREERFYGALHG